MTNMQVFYNDDYGLSPESFETTRKAGFVAQHIEKHGKAVDLVDPKTVVKKQAVLKTVKKIHDDEYVKALQTGISKTFLHESSGFEWGDKTLDFALAHSHGVVAAIDTVLGGPHTRSGSLSSGLHHASPESGAGFCTINGLAVGAAHALAHKSGKRKVMILDFDAHCGGGTFAHIKNLENAGYAQIGDVIQIDVSVDRFDRYPTYAPNYLDILNLRDDQRPTITYLRGISKGLVEAEKAYEDGMIVIYNAGIDPINLVDFPDGALAMRERDELVSDWIGNKPAVFTLAGGYKWGGWTMDELAQIHFTNIDMWAQYCQDAQRKAA